MVAAGVLLAMAEPRPHVLAFLIGSAIVALLSIAHFLVFSPGIGLMHRQDWAAWDHQKFAFINGGISFVGHGLIAFGLFSFAIVHLRRTRQEKALDQGEWDGMTSRPTIYFFRFPAACRRASLCG